jgi:cytochrome c
MSKSLALLLVASCGVLAGTSGARATEPDATTIAIGEALFEQRCGRCHAKARGETSLAPTLHGVVGRKAGSVEGFPYTPRISMLDLVWTEQSLWTWLQSTSFDTPLIAMRHVGVKTPAEADALVAYLATLR